MSHQLSAGGSLTDGAVDGREPAEPGGEPALQVSVCGPTAAGPLWLWRTDAALLWNLQTCLLPGEFLQYISNTVCVRGRGCTRASVFTSLTSCRNLFFFSGKSWRENILLIKSDKLHHWGTWVSSHSLTFSIDHHQVRSANIKFRGQCPYWQTWQYH